MDYSTFYPLLFFAVALVSNSINSSALEKLTPEQQQAAGSAQSTLWWLMIPLLVVVAVSIWFANEIESLGWLYALYALAWAVPMLIIFTWENYRLRAKELPSSYLKARLLSQVVLVGGCLLVLLWR